MRQSLRSWILAALGLLLVAACGGSGGDSGSGGPGPGPAPGPGPGTSLTLSNVQTAADPHWGVRELSLPYRVAASGFLVVSASWFQGTPANNPTFNGTNLILMAHAQTTIARLRIVHGAMYYLPVTAGQSGSIRITYPADARRASLSAVTVAGATSMVGVQTALANVSPSPLGLDVRVVLTAPAMVITLLSSSADIDSVVTGTAHFEDSNPTLPLDSFHDGRTYTGHAAVGTGTHTLGYAQDPAHSPPPSPQRLYDAVMLAGIFR